MLTNKFRSYSFGVIQFIFAMVFIIATALADTMPQHLQFKDGIEVNISGNQQVIISKNHQTLSKSWFGDNGYDYWQAVKFVQQLQKAVNNKDKNLMVTMILFPLHINGVKRQLIKTQKDFLTNYASIFTPAIQTQIKTLNPYNLFCNQQGITFASGIVWINNSPRKPQDLKIFAINH